MNLPLNLELMRSVCRFPVLEKKIPGTSYVVFNYVCSTPEMHNDPILQEGRGIVFNEETGVVVSRPYHKFYNVGEYDAVAIEKIDLSRPHVILEKLDGSMIHPVVEYTSDGFVKIVLFTRAGPSDVAKQAQEFLDKSPVLQYFIDFMTRAGNTPVLEWCSRKNRVVIDHPIDRLVLTAIRVKQTGYYFPYSEMKEMALANQVDCVGTVGGCGLSVEEVMKHIAPQINTEGVVVRFEDGLSPQMVKIKAADYLRLHSSIDSLKSPKKMLQMVLSHTFDDLIPLITEEDALRVSTFGTKITTSVRIFAQAMQAFVAHAQTGKVSRKDFAVEVKGCPQSGYLFKLFSIESLSVAAAIELAYSFLLDRLNKIDLEAVSELLMIDIANLWTSEPSQGE